MGECLVFGLKPSVCYSGLGCEMCCSPRLLGEQSAGSDESLSHMFQSLPASRLSPDPCSYKPCQSQEPSGVLSHESTDWLCVCLFFWKSQLGVPAEELHWLARLGLPINSWTWGAISQPVNRPVNRPVNQSDGEPVKQLVSQGVNRVVKQVKLIWVSKVSPEVKVGHCYVTDTWHQISFKFCLQMAS